MQQANLNSENIFKLIEENKQLLKQQHFPQDINKFFKQWYLFAENEQLLIEQMYVWSMIFGWSLQKEERYQKIQIDQISTEIISEEKVSESHSFQENLANQNNIQIKYIKPNQVIIQAQDAVYWINPTYQQSSTSVVQTIGNLVVILLSASSRKVLDLIKIKQTNKTARIITVDTIYRKIQFLLNFLKEYEPEKYKQITFKRVYLLKVDQYFEYGDYLWLARRNCWYQPSFDLIFAKSDSKKHQFLIQNQKLKSTKYLYYGWKKQTISQQNYQKYTANQTQGFLCSSTYLSPPNNKQPKNTKYLKFISTEVIKDLKTQQQQLIWRCLEQVSYITEQIVVKKGTRFDYLFILIDGDIEISQQQQVGKNREINKQLFGLAQLIQNNNYYERTVKAKSRTDILRISKYNFKFHLFDMLESKMKTPFKNN